MHSYHTAFLERSELLTWSLILVAVWYLMADGRKTPMARACDLQRHLLIGQIKIRHLGYKYGVT
jgi:hypothetical protein